MSYKNLFDSIVIGVGPAGMSAAVYLARKGVKALIIGDVVGGQTALSGEVDNYLGFSLMKGTDLGEKFNEHIQTFGNLEHIYNTKVAKIEKIDIGFRVFVENDEIYESKTLIIASGKKPREIGVLGEKELKNKGVTYCATCDAPLFNGKVVAVIGGGNSALDAAIQLLNFSPKIYLININEKLNGDAIMKDKLHKSSKVEIINKAETLEIKGENFVSGLKIKAEGKERLLDVGGIFVEIGSIPSVEFIPAEIELNNRREIILKNRNMTSIPGIFAAGDVTDVIEKQTVVAAGEGAKAAIQVSEYLNKII